MKKKDLLCLLLMAFCILIMAPTVNAEEGETIQCGTDVYAKLSSTGTLTISGSGDMWDCAGLGSSYFYDIREEIYQVVIEDGVTSIGAYAFASKSSGTYRFSCLQSVSIGSDVASIGDYAFYYCVGLYTINIPGNVKTIGNRAFAESGLKSCTLNEGLKTIGEYAFWYTKLSSIVIPDGMSSIESYAFINCSSLKNVTIPENITIIKRGAFGNVGATIYSKTVVIGTGAFGTNSTFKAERGSTADTYASNYDIDISYFQHSITVTFDANGGTVSTSSSTVTSETYYGDLPAPSRKGCAFEGWYTEKTDGSKVTATTLVTSATDITLYAHWTEISVGTASAPTVSGQSGGKISVRLSSVSGADGYQIAYSLKSDMSSSSSKSVTTLSKTISGLKGGKTYYVRVRAYRLDSASSKVYGSWSTKVKVTLPSKVTLNANGGSVSTKSISVLTGSKYGTLPVAKRKGYTFSGWYTAKSGGSHVKASTKVTATANSTLYAHWKKVTVKKASRPTVQAKSSSSISVKITAIGGVKGYQIRYSLKKSMSSSRTITVSTRANRIYGLKSGNKYYVQVRAYKLDSKGSKVYGSWSTAAAVKLP